MRVLSCTAAAVLIVVGACTPEATAPQAGAAVGKVVPVAVPDVWCPANRAPEDTAQVNNLPACHTTVEVPPPPLQPTARDSTWHPMSGSPVVARDSIRLLPDTTR
jgi:hypothetical protein